MVRVRCREVCIHEWRPEIDEEVIVAHLKNAIKEMKDQAVNTRIYISPVDSTIISIVDYESKIAWIILAREVREYSFEED